MRLATLSLIYVIFGIYGWLCIVNTGVAMIRLLPRSTFTRQGQRLFAPAWEVTQLFLLVGVAALLLCFHNRAGEYVRPVAPLLIAAASLLVVRVAMVVVLFALKARSGLRGYNLLFLLVTLALPFILGVAGVQLLSDAAFWQTIDGWLLMATLMVGLLSGGLALVYFVVGRTPHDRLHQVSRLFNVLLAALIGIGVQLVVRHRMPQLRLMPYEDFIVLGIFVAVWQVGLWLSARERYMWWYLSLLTILTPLLWGLAGRPYIAYQRVSTVSAYSVSTAHGHWVVVGLAVLIVILLAMTAYIASWLLRARKHNLR